MIPPSRFASPRLRFFGRSALALGAALATQISLVPEAKACGGFFCSQSSPVNQAAERIVFSKNDDGTVTAVIQIMYSGPSESFAWVLPVPGEPEIGIGSNIGFQRIQQASNPSYQLQTQLIDSCTVNNSSGARGGVLSGPTAESDDGSGPVTVLDHGIIGNYQFQTIGLDPNTPDPADVAVDWLEASGYDVAGLGRDTLGPYLANGLNLLALKLTKGSDSGSIRPVILTYESQIPAIPIKPTAVAANDDMGVMVWVLGESRAVPTNYKSLVLNEALINWFNPGVSYNDVVTAAANEAEGQGFVTEFAGASDAFPSQILFDSEEQNLAMLSETSDPVQVLELSGFLAGFDGYLDVVREHVPLPTGVSAEDFAGCPSCYAYETGPNGSVFAQMDVAAYLAAIEEDVVGPMRAMRDLFEGHAYTTRLYTTMSADEMTLDPMFEFNPDLEDVSNLHTATQYVSCRNDGYRIVLEDGREIYGTNSTWPFNPGEVMPANLMIEQLSTSGSAELLTDNSDAIQGILDQNNAPFEKQNSGCACSLDGPQPSRSTWLWSSLGLVGFAMLRRRLAR